MTTAAAAATAAAKANKASFFSWIPLTSFDHANHIDIDHESASIFGIGHFSVGFFDV